MPTTRKISHADVRMYRMGTGDCFIIKFFAGKKESFTMMIDCGTWQGKKDFISDHVKDLKQYVNNSVDLLVVTHEHKDHVYGFGVCSDLFTGEEPLKVKQTWMAWTERDDDKEVKKWKRNYGEKKKALHIAAQEFSNAMNDKDFIANLKNELNGKGLVDGRTHYGNVLDEFIDLHFGVAKGRYIGGLEGMDVVKKKLAGKSIEYLKPGMVKEGLQGANGLRFYVLGPPLDYSSIKSESGKHGETYDHNDLLAKNNAFAAAMISSSPSSPDLLPFDKIHSDPNPASKSIYDSQPWRKIDYDWLNSSGLLALRMNSLTNNLSVVLAIEFVDSGRVMLFPGDAEFGSWNSWHSVDWGHHQKAGNKHLTEDLLNRTVFYKVAHHLSHNGTAKEKGLDLMTDPDLMAMATLDYDHICPGWTSTMPNRALLKDLVDKTKGRLVIMNDTNLFFDIRNKEPLGKKIKEARKRMTQQEQEEFENSLKVDPLYYQLTVRGV